MNRNRIFSYSRDSGADMKYMTRNEFCDLLEIDYDKIMDERRKNAEMIFSDFVDELLEIKDVCKHLHKCGWDPKTV